MYMDEGRKLMVMVMVMEIMMVMVTEAQTQDLKITTTTTISYHHLSSRRPTLSFLDVSLNQDSHTPSPFTVSRTTIDVMDSGGYQEDILPLVTRRVNLSHVSLGNVSRSSGRVLGGGDGFFQGGKLLHKKGGVISGVGEEGGGGRGTGGEEGGGGGGTGGEGRGTGGEEGGGGRGTGGEEGGGGRSTGGEEEWRECPQLDTSKLVQEGFRRSVSLGLKECARLWCWQVEGSGDLEQEEGVYHVVLLGHVAEQQHQCLLNITNMIVLHHSWPMCSSDFVCATNHSVFEMSASGCMPWRCWAAETVVLVFMLLASTCITGMSVVIMSVIIACPQFHKPKYYLRFSLAATDFFIGTIVCGHAAYNQWVGLTEIPRDRFPYYSNLKEGQLFRHVPNCLWGVSDVLTQISGFFVTSNMIISLYTLSLMSLDRYLLLTRTHYRTLVTSRRVTAALVVSWCCGLIVPSLHFVYRPQKQDDICINYDTSPLDVHIINIESKIATADYKVYLKYAVPLSVTLVVVGFPIITLLVFSFRTLRKYNSYTRDRSVRQVKSALQLTHNHCSLSRQASSTSLAAMVNLIATPTPSHAHPHITRGRADAHTSTPPPYKLKFTFKKKTKDEDRSYDPKMSTSLMQHPGVGDVDGDDYTPSLAGRDVVRTSSGSVVEAASVGREGGASDRTYRESVLGALGMRRLLPSHSHHVAATIRRLRGTVIGGTGERVRERDREITCTVLVNVAVFVFACFPLLAVGGWMMFLYFTQQDTINNPAPLKQLLFVAPWLMALNSLWNAVLHLSYNHKFRSAARHMIWSNWRKLCRVFCRHGRSQE